MLFPRPMNLRAIRFILEFAGGLAFHGHHVPRPNGGFPVRSLTAGGEKRANGGIKFRLNEEI